MLSTGSKMERARSSICWFKKEDISCGGLKIVME